MTETSARKLLLVPLLPLLPLLGVACAPPGDGGDDAQMAAALATIAAEDLAADIAILASDEFEGRLPSTAGEEKTLEFLKNEFEAVGLEPGNGDSWFQEVPLVSVTADPGMTLTITAGDASAQYAYGEQFMAWTKRVVDETGLDDSEMIFVGYGVVAPEYGWNDYEGIDVTGKTVVMLVNDPGYTTEDPEQFNGRTMTYYGRWTYKYEEAARQGAAGALVVHETGPAGYPWGVVSGSWAGAQFDLVSEDGNMSRIQLEGWLTLDAAREIFAMGGQDYDDLKDRALDPDFQAVPLGTSASAVIHNTLDRSVSNNVIAKLPGTDRADEYVIYMAHWDHMGRDPSLEGDQIFNGARDNATGTAALIELAEAFASLETRPSRSILFIPVTAEEQGLLGSAHYGANPVYPLNKTVGAINLDAMNAFGPTTDVTVVGLGNSELDDYVIAAAAAQGREARPDSEPEKGFYYRSDHFSLAKYGVPALYIDSGSEHVNHGADWVTEWKAVWTADRYHKPADEFNDTWDLSGMAEDVQLAFMVDYKLPNDSSFPNWREGTEFKAIRDAMMQ